MFSSELIKCLLAIVNGLHSKSQTDHVRPRQGSKRSCSQTVVSPLEGLMPLNFDFCKQRPGQMMSMHKPSTELCAAAFLGLMPATYQASEAGPDCSEL